MLSRRVAVFLSNSVHSSTDRLGTRSSRITAQEQYSALRSQPIHLPLELLGTHERGFRSGEGVRNEVAFRSEEAMMSFRINSSGF